MQVKAWRGQQPTGPWTHRGEPLVAQQRRSAGCWPLLGDKIVARVGGGRRQRAVGRHAGWHIAARYRPDHTAHVRRRLAPDGRLRSVRPVVAAGAAGILAVIGSRALAASKALMSAAWVTDAASLPSPSYTWVTLVAWLSTGGAGPTGRRGCRHRRVPRPHCQPSPRRHRLTPSIRDADSRTHARTSSLVRRDPVLLSTQQPRRGTCWADR